MKRVVGYSLVLTLLVCCIYAFSFAQGESSSTYANMEQAIPSVPNDTTTRYPVKKTQVTNYDDLKKNNPIDLKDPPNVKTEVIYDPASGLYIYRTTIGDQEITTPLGLSSDEYFDYTQKQSMSNYFKRRNTMTAEDIKDDSEFSLKDINVNIGSAERIFGPGGVRVRTNGYVETTMGIKYSKLDDPTISERNRKRTTFDFKENIQMNVNASVGDKVNFGLNYDTKAMFDFDSKKLKLAYEGKEDEIIKNISAGNVGMSTTNSLINAGTTLFGITSELQFGKLKVAAVVSQQEAQAQIVNSKGNTQTTDYEFKADNYDENRHFFLAYYFRDNYETSMAKLPLVQSSINITDIEVWITNKRSSFDNARNIVALSDLAEHKHIQNTLWTPQGTLDIPYNNANNEYDYIRNTYPGARDINQVTQLLSPIMESNIDYEKVESARLLSSNEYTLNARLGYISLNSALQQDEVLAVAYKYTMNGKTYQVGEFSTDVSATYNSGNTSSGALFVKMLKSVTFSPVSHTWDLMMKNVYYVGANDIQKEGFRLNIAYYVDTLGSYINYIPEGQIAKEPLLRVMGLDRLDFRQNPNPDGIFDYVEGYTINSSTGRVYFPVVEPFGSHLATKIGNTTISDKYIYQQLYDTTKTAAQQIADRNRFKIFGTYRGSSINSCISLGSVNVPQGSVKVTANGIVLTEGTDYTVDYAGGCVTIINQSLVETNANIQVSLENQLIASMQRKTLLGLNLSYDISKKFNVGATIMHLYEKPLVMKPEIGNESVKNTLWGVNTSYSTESQWLTNLMNKIPLLNLTNPSQISFNAEFAQMIAGHYQDSESGGGYSYIDDFENAESRIDLKTPYAWSLASTPKVFPESQLTNDIEYGKNRSMFSWFMIDNLFTRKNSSLTPYNIKNDLTELSNNYVREISVYEIYPALSLAVNQSTTLPVLNLSFYPKERGPYNLDATNITDDGSLLNPKDRWGGMTRKMDVTDFEKYNIEYLEFWLMDPFASNNQGAALQNGGDLYINLGEISEDILKDGKKFYENGLPINDDPTAVETTVWGKVPKRQSTVYAFDNSFGEEGRKKQDVGYNGLSVEEEKTFPTYASYVQNYKSKLSTNEIVSQSDQWYSPFNAPAKDKYHYFLGEDYDREELGILGRYKFYNNTEGNSPIMDETSSTYSTAARRVPDVEDVDQNYTLNENESYYEYKIELKKSKLKLGENYITEIKKSTVTLRDGSTEEITWYQFKVPIKNYTDKRGSIQGFNSIRFMRMYLTNFDENVFLRFGSLQLVRGEWRVYGESLNAGGAPSGTTGSLDMSTVSIVQDDDRQPVNYVLPPGVSQVNTTDQAQPTKENEQSLSLRIDDLTPKDARAIYKNTTYDLRYYKKLQMFTHLEELVDGPALSNGELSIFMRLGTDYKNNYYEYEIPLKVTPFGKYFSSISDDRYKVWPRDNMFDISLELLKDIKLNRNKAKKQSNSTVSYSTLYTEYDPNNLNNKISVMGNPSLGEVSVIMIGIRNNSSTTKSGIVWIDELRLTDFNDEGGWAAQGNLNLVLSDLGTLNLSGRKETVGFGALDQSLMNRRQDDYTTYNISTNVQLGKFFPEKAKVNLPMYYSYSNQTTTPKYDPFDTDVTLKESLSLVTTKAEKDSIKSLAQEKNTTKSFSMTNVKVDIQSKTPMPYDPANFNLGYAFSENEINTPSTIHDITQNYKLSLGYTYSPIVKTWEPFKNRKGNSATDKFVKSIGINYIPSNISLNSNMTRYYTETLLRDIDSYSLGGVNNSEYLYFSHSFYWDRDLNINWDFTKNLKASIQTGTRAEIYEPDLQVNKKVNKDDYDKWKDTVIQSIKNLGNPLEYRQHVTLTYQLPFKDIQALNWITSNASYSSTYEWARGAYIEGEEIGNSINNSITIEFANRLNMTSLYNKSTFLKNVNQRFDSKPKQSPTQRLDKKKEIEKKVKKVSRAVTLSKDSSYLIHHNLQTKDIIVRGKRNNKDYPVKYKKVDDKSILITNRDTGTVQLVIEEKYKDPNTKSIWREVGEYSARGLMSLRTLNINYSKRKETYITGFEPGIGDAFGQRNSAQGMSPGLGFALGLEGGEDYINKSIEKDWIIFNSNSITPAIFNNIEKFDFKAQLEPIKNLKIDLNASRETNRSSEILLYTFDNKVKTFGGSFSMTTVALATSLRSTNAKNGYYSKAFNDFLENRNIIKGRLDQAYTNMPYPNQGFINDMGIIGTYNPSASGGVNINSGDVMIPAFMAAYTGKKANSSSLSIFPSLLSIIPNWKISYDGFTSISGIKDKIKRLKVSHSYSCYYQINSYSTFVGWVGDGDMGFIQDALTGNPIPSSPYNISAVTITELFNPLIGLEGTLNNNMSLNGQYNTGRTLSLNMNSYQIIESLQKEIIVGLGYRINEFNRVIGFTTKKPNGFNNDLNIKADFSHKTQQALLRKIEEEFTQATSGVTVITLKLSADYALSRSLSIKAFFDKILNKPLVTTSSYPKTDANFGISVKFTLLQ